MIHIFDGRLFRSTETFWSLYSVFTFWIRSIDQFSSSSCSLFTSATMVNVCHTKTRTLTICNACPHLASYSLLSAMSQFPCRLSGPTHCLFHIWGSSYQFFNILKWFCLLLFLSPYLFGRFTNTTWTKIIQTRRISNTLCERRCYCNLCIKTTGGSTIVGLIVTYIWTI